jgi:hypothetical protein
LSINKIISFWGIGSGGKPETRFTQFINSKTGWNGFVAQADFQRQLDAGVKRFLLWMPFGRDDLRQQTVNGIEYPTVLRFDAYPQAKKANLPWLTTGFADAIKPLTEKGVQVIAYMGSLPGSPEFETESGLVRRAYLDDALEPFEDAECDYCFDTACLAPKSHYCTNIVYGLRRKGTRVYCESMPRADQPHWAEGDVLSSELQYQAALAPGNRSVLCDPKAITGELVRGIWDAVVPPYKNYVDYYQAVVPKALADGHSVCLQVRHFMAQGGKLEGLI